MGSVFLWNKIEKSILEGILFNLSTRNYFTIFAPASRFIGLTFTVSQESPGNAGHRAS